MKIKFIVQLFAAFSFVLGCTATSSKIGSAQSATFFCGTRKDTPATVARTSRGDVPIIRWVSTYFSGTGYTPASRCVEVSKRFQTYYDNGTLNYITTGTVNRQPVVCVAQSPGSGCSQVLFTLEERDDPNQVLQELFDIRVRAANGPITRGESQASQEPIYIDMNEYLSKTPVEEGITPISENSPENAPVRSATPPNLGQALQQVKSNEEAVGTIEKSWERDYENYFKTNLSDTSMGSEEIAATLGKLAAQTGKKTALIYAVPTPNTLELVLVMPQRKPIRKTVTAANTETLQNVAKQLTQEITDFTKVNTTSYLAPAQQLYQWIVAPLSAELEANKIDNLIFCMGGGLRSLPLAALHDGQQFLVEKYSIGLIPAFNMTDPVYKDVKNLPILAMGASQFKEQAPLAAVPVELGAIMQDLSGVLWPGSWRGKEFLNQEFTLDNLRSQRASQPFGIVHLATHAEFKSGAPENSYIQFWDSKLTLDKMRQLQWNNPPVELLVLSACRTAVGDKDAEMGFAGLAVNSGVKSALASLWSVSDEGTLALMTEFYQQLRVAPIKAEALRQSQIGMLRGQVVFEGGKLRGPMLRDGMLLPPKLAPSGTRNFKHPFYWAAFTMIGSPW
ncbi:CHAT domain-containing protein [Aerosakkonema sp. BLCC-F183]|uniref:CHAT domain-containing protein n=1 Tax=Aerosakkonema sp. BLCC-F183 TaxID=3342834 RepID=UPI0035B79C0F